jgi:hypothetical protein
VRRPAFLRSLPPLAQRDPKSVLPIPEVTHYTTLSRDTLKRRHGDKYVQLSPNRVGITVENTLAIVEGRDK